LVNNKIFIFLQLSHGADAFLKNQEGQTPLELATADDVRSLLQDAMVVTSAVPRANSPSMALAPLFPSSTEPLLMPSGTSICLPLPIPRSDSNSSPCEGRCSDSRAEDSTDPGPSSSLQAFLQRLALFFIHRCTIFNRAESRRIILVFVSTFLCRYWLYILCNVMIVCNFVNKCLITT